MNHEYFDERLAFIRRILQENGLQATDVYPVDYDENLPFPYNNFIYKVTLTAPATDHDFRNGRAYTTKPPREGTSSLIIRLSNPAAEGLNHQNRVQNEVAALYLARRGLETFKREMAYAIPAVYAWGPPLKDNDATSTSQLGWIIMEFKRGVPLDGVFFSLSSSQKKHALGQLADIFGGIQTAPIHTSLKSCSGIMIDESESLVPGQMTTLSGAPWKTYGAFWDRRISSQLEYSESSTLINGWKSNGVRERLDRLLKTGLSSILENHNVDLSLRSLVHGDLTLNNVLFDQDTNNITGLVDFDFASILHPCQEFFTSFQDIGGSTSGGHKPDLTGGRLTNAVITGMFDQEDHVPTEAQDAWFVAKTWDEALKVRGLLRPCEIAGISALTSVGRLEGLVCPFKLVHPVFIKKMTEEDAAKARVEAEKALSSCLESLGF